MRVLVADPIAKEGIDLLAREQTVDVKTGLPKDELLRIIGDYHALVVRSETKVTREVLGAAELLQVVGRAGVGVDNIDVPAATERGVLVVNSPTGNVLAAAEHTIALLLALSRQIPQANAALKAGVWDRKTYIGTQVQNKVLGLIGLGRVGSEVAMRAQGLKLRVVAFDPYLTPEGARRLGVELLPLDEVLRQADYLSFHIPLTPETRNLVGAEQLALVKPTAILLNTSRGGIVDEKLLFEALTEGRLGGAALDVFETEPAVGNPLIGLSNVVATPHLGGSTREAQIEVAVDVAEQVLAALRGEAVPNAINLPSLPPERVHELTPYVVLAGKLGKLLGNWVEAPIDSLEVRYGGSLAERNTSLITLSALKGFLEPRLSEQVNWVNAQATADRRGIKVLEHKEITDSGLRELVTLVATAAGQQRSVAGSLLGTDPRLLRIDNYHVDVELRGCLLVGESIDRPGMIGRIGTILGNRNVNVAFMQVGRDQPGQRAVSVLQVDGPVGQDVLEEIETIDGIMDMKFVDMGR